MIVTTTAGGEGPPVEARVGVVGGGSLIGATRLREARATALAIEAVGDGAAMIAVAASHTALRAER